MELEAMLEIMETTECDAQLIINTRAVLGVRCCPSQISVYLEHILIEPKRKGKEKKILLSKIRNITIESQ